MGGHNHIAICPRLLIGLLDILHNLLHHRKLRLRKQIFFQLLNIQLGEFISIHLSSLNHIIRTDFFILIIQHNLCHQTR
ncbi:Uncharacterised protein [Segatella copri]|nr:Uncharacterised protein [Segatella copri]